MTAADSATDDLATSLHRSLLGVLLAVAVLFGLGWSWRALGDGNLAVAAGGLLVAFGGGYWTLDLFLQGVRQR